MKSKSFDVLIVGAGPAGMFAAYELVTRSPKIKIALIEMGQKIENRDRNNVMHGVGGAGTFSDGKLTLTANLSHEKSFHLISKSDYQDMLDYVDKILTNFGVDSEYYPKNNQDAVDLIEDAQRNGIELVIRKARHVGTDKLALVMKSFQDFLVEKRVEIIEDTEVKDLHFIKENLRGVITVKGEKILGEKVLLAPGRVKANWLQEIASKYDIEYTYDKVEVGVRVEFPEFVMRKHEATLYETVYKLNTPTYDDVVRTFCYCPRGMVSIEKYDGYVCVNGHSNADHASVNSNFAFLCEVALTEPVENTIAYARSVAKLASTIGGGKPIIQRLADLKKGRRSTWHRIEKSIVSPSLRDVTPGDISMALPHRVVTNIIEGLTCLNQVMPGIDSGSTLLYAPEVKFRSSKIKTDGGLQTNIKNVFVAGDAAGLSGSITGAAVNGIMAAKGILGIN